jgi:hypothetical protein
MGADLARQGKQSERTVEFEAVGSVPLGISALQLFLAFALAMGQDRPASRRPASRSRDRCRQLGLGLRSLVAGLGELSV